MKRNRRAMLAICQSSFKGVGMYFDFILNNNNNHAIPVKTICFDIFKFGQQWSFSQWVIGTCEWILTLRFNARCSSVVLRVWFVRHKCVISFSSFLCFWQEKESKIRTWLSQGCAICSRAVSAGCWIFHTGPSYATSVTLKRLQQHHCGAEPLYGRAREFSSCMCAS